MSNDIPNYEIIDDLNDHIMTQVHKSGDNEFICTAIVTRASATPVFEYNLNGELIDTKDVTESINGEVTTSSN